MVTDVAAVAILELIKTRRNLSAFFADQLLPTAVSVGRRPHPERQLPGDEGGAGDADQVAGVQQLHGTQLVDWGDGGLHQPSAAWEVPPATGQSGW